jgi:hypothetical protein
VISAAAMSHLSAVGAVSAILTRSLCPARLRPRVRAVERRHRVNAGLDAAVERRGDRDIGQAGLGGLTVSSSHAAADVRHVGRD